MSRPAAKPAGIYPYPLVRRIFVVFARSTTILVLGAGAGLAQAPICTQIRAELASLAYQQNAINPQMDAEAAQIRNELVRVRVAIQRNECDRGFLLFSSTPAVCAPLKAQAQQLESRLRAIDNAANASPLAQRRNLLVAALDRYQCNGNTNQQVQRPPGVISGGPQPQQDSNLLERLFGSRANNSSPGGVSSGVVDPRFPPPQSDDPVENKSALGGRMAVCVRTCDGYFFPINFEGIGQRDDYDQVCKSLCPAAETRVFFKSYSGDIERAASRDGSPYSSQPYALKYRERRDATCTCKSPNQTWAQATRGTEDIVEARKGDILVTPEKALALSRPKDVAVSEGKIKSAPNAKTPPAKASPKREEADSLEAVPESALPTGGTASSGIGPKLNAQKVIGTTQGKREDVVGKDGLHRQVRVIAPGLGAPEPLPALKGATAPSAQAPSRAP